MCHIYCSYTFVALVGELRESLTNYGYRFDSRRTGVLWVSCRLKELAWNVLCSISTNICGRKRPESLRLELVLRLKPAAVRHGDFKNK